MKKYFIYLAAAAMTLSCAENSVEVTPEVETDALTNTTITVAAPALTTKVAVTENGDAWSVTWLEDDALGAWSLDAAAESSNEFTITEGGYSAESSTFAGSLPSGTTAIRLVHPYDAALAKVENKVALSLENQAVGADLAHIAANTYMISDQVDLTAASAQEPISMSHIGAAIELKMKFADANGLDENQYSVTEVTVGSSEEGVALPLSGELDLSDGSFAVTASGAIKVSSAEGIADSEGVYTISFNTFPFSVEADSSIPVSVKLVDRYDNAFVAEATIACEGAIAKATKNTLYALLTMVDVTPVTFPVVYPLGYGEGDYYFSADKQPRWITESVWTCHEQKQSYATWNKVSDPSDTMTQYIERVNSKSVIGSPGIKGIWTGDYFEFMIPVENFAANSTIEIKFPMYTRCGPTFWNIEYQDGVDGAGDEIWKCNTTNQVSYDPDYSMDCTFAIAYNVGAVVEHSMTFENAIESGYLKIRIVCADGSLQATGSGVIEAVMPYNNKTAYTAPFYLYASGSDVKSVSFTLKE